LSGPEHKLKPGPGSYENAHHTIQKRQEDKIAKRLISKFKITEETRNKPETDFGQTILKAAIESVLPVGRPPKRSKRIILGKSLAKSSS